MMAIKELEHQQSFAQIFCFHTRRAVQNKEQTPAPAPSARPADSLLIALLGALA